MMAIKVSKKTTVMLGEGEHMRGAYCAGIHSLMRGIDELGSLYAASRAVGMAYSKAWRIMGAANEVNGMLIEPKGANGSDITPLGREMMALYEREAGESE